MPVESSSDSSSSVSATSSSGFSSFSRFVLPERVDQVCNTPPYVRFADPKYGERLVAEVSEVDAVGFWPQLCFAAEVVRLARLPPRVPHVCRGSAGSSLLCYLVGITDIDPVAAGIAFTRFLGGRDKPPDVDLDFPSDLRPALWERIRARFGDRVGFVATSLRYRSQGALREALRQCGISYELWVSPFAVLPETSRERVISLASKLEGSQFALARHCGGLVLFPSEVPPPVRTARSREPFYQLSLTKDDVGSTTGLGGGFGARGKLDVLSNRALSQLCALGRDPAHDLSGEHLGAGKIFSQGDTWGIVQGESPAMRKLFLSMGVSTLEGVILCLGLVRPATGSGKQGAVGRNPLERLLVFEDDVTEFLGVILGCRPESAEQARRALGKGGELAQGVLRDVEAVCRRSTRGRVSFRGKEMTWTEVRKQLGFVRAFAFCKAHASAYGRLVWALGVAKAEDPRGFWEAFLNTALTSSMYLPWVHFERIKMDLDVEVLWPGDLGLAPGRFFSVPWRISGDFVGPVLGSQGPAQTPALFSFGGDDPELWLRQLSCAGFWAGRGRSIPRTWARRSDGTMSFRGLAGLKSPRLHPLGDGRACLFSTLGHGQGGVIEYSRLITLEEGQARLPEDGLLVSGQGRVRTVGSVDYVSACFNSPRL